jgi:hypothetical protein
MSLGVSSAAMFVSSATLLGFMGAVFISWLKYGRDILPPGAILLIFPYVFRKVPLYCNILLRKFDSQWIRTDRKKI